MLKFSLKREPETKVGLFLTPPKEAEKPSHSPSLRSVRVRTLFGRAFRSSKPSLIANGGFATVFGALRAQASPSAQLLKASQARLCALSCRLLCGLGLFQPSTGLNTSCFDGSIVRSGLFQPLQASSLRSSAAQDVVPPSCAMGCRVVVSLVSLGSSSFRSSVPSSLHSSPILVVRCSGLLSKRPCTWPKAMYTASREAWRLGQKGERSVPKAWRHHRLQSAHIKRPN